MAGHTTHEIDSVASWKGKVSPFSTSYGKLMMWFFLVSDALTFGGLLVGYGFIRHAYTGKWPIGEEVFNSLPFAGHGYPLVYVALMTFLLIISSVTMVLAVEAGHRMDRKGVTKWMLMTIIGGFFFLGSQAWEWAHFIHGSELGRVQLHDGSLAYVKGHGAEFESFEIIAAGGHHHVGEVIKTDLAHEYNHAVAAGHVLPDGSIRLHDGSVAKVNVKKPAHIEHLLIRQAGGEYALDHEIKGAEAAKLYNDAVRAGEANRVVFGANLQQNEYGPQQYAQFFFFITGFHGFHVFSGVLINILIFFGVLRGVYHKRGHYEMVEKTGLYWHFVDLVWVFVFTFFYLV
jgi:cytochrome c oxidase subunit III